MLSVQTEVDEKLAEGKKKYIAVQDELNDIVELINQVQQRFMSSYKEVHRIISSMPESMQEMNESRKRQRRKHRQNHRKRLRTALTRRTVMSWMRDIMALLNEEDEE